MLSEFIFIFFRIVNFFTVAWVLIYLAKKYWYQGVKNHLQSHTITIHSLQQEQEALSQQHALLDVQFLEQEQEAAQLEKKLIQWKVTCRQREQEFLHAQQRIDEKRVVQQGLQQTEYFKDKIQKIALPVIVQKAKEELDNYFQDEQHGKRYLHTTISRLKESV